MRMPEVFTADPAVVGQLQRALARHRNALPQGRFSRGDVDRWLHTTRADAPGQARVDHALADLVIDGELGFDATARQYVARTTP